jgi:hypothetical protein
MKKSLFSAFAVIVMAFASMAQRVADLKPGDLVPLSARNYVGLGKPVTCSLEECIANNLFSKEEIVRMEANHRKALKALKGKANQKGGNPSVLNITGGMAFFTSAIDTQAFYFDYLGSTGPFDQIGFQHGKASASMFDTTMVQYVTSMPAGQAVFVRKNLISGTQYRFKFFVFDAANGTVTFYPGGNGCYYATTVWVSQTSISSQSFLYCSGAVKIADVALSTNNPQTWIRVVADTGANPTFNSIYSLTYSMPQFNIGAIGTTNSYTIDVSQVIKYVPHPANTTMLYSVKVIMSTTNWKDSTISTCGIYAAVNELSQGESFTIFPNPIVDQAVIKSTVEGNLTLYDLTGREVGSQRISQGQSSLDHKDMLPGFYFYRLIADEGKGELSGKLLFVKE